MPATAPQTARPRTPPAPRGLPFAHPQLSQAGPNVVHENCTKQALWVVAYQLRDVHRRAERVRADQAKKPKPKSKLKNGPAQANASGGEPGLVCPTAEADELSRQVRSETLRRVGACVGRDGPLDPEWDMVNSGVLSLGVCLDCSRAPAARAKDCKTAIDVIDRADKLAHGAGVDLPVRANGGR